MKTCMEHIIALQFKLLMFGIPVEEETKVLCDNKATIDNGSKIDSTQKKKYSSVVYHAVHWTVAAKIIVVGWIDTILNLADAFTKKLSEIKRDQLFEDRMY